MSAGFSGFSAFQWQNAHQTLVVIRRTADARRDRAFARLGYRVVRVEADLVLRGLPAALARIRAALGA